MWRLQGLVGRVLHRYHANSPLRLSQNHHDEVINTSSVLSTSRQPSDSSSQKEGDGERGKKRRTYQFGCAELPRYTALDAVGWGAAAVLFMQICRRIHAQFSSGADSAPTPGALTAPSTLQKCGYRILLEILSRRDVLPRGRSVLCLQGVPERQNTDQSSAQSSSSSSISSSGGDASPPSSSERDHLTADFAIADHQRALLIQNSPIPEELLLSASWDGVEYDANQNGTETKDTNSKDLSDEKRLAGAALNLRRVGDTSVPVVLNIIGLESAKSENYEEAFTCFLAAAQQGYSKAQFNTGVCYEKGRGVSKDKEKALYYYRLAAFGGHRQAQYHYAKLLLSSRRHQSVEELDTAITQLEQAAAAGLTKAQVCLASVYSQESVRDGHKSVQYLQMAAKSGDDTALLFLGHCYESGFGVQQNLRTAIEFYKRAAQAGNVKAKILLMLPNESGSEAEDAVLRSIRSAPCFSASDRRPQPPLSSLAGHPVTLPLLPHSRSAGILCVPPSSTPLHLHPRSIEGGNCQWTLGFG